MKTTKLPKSINTNPNANYLLPLCEKYDGNTIVLITHDSDIARQAKRIVRIQDGKITRDSESDSEVVCE